MIGKVDVISTYAVWILLEETNYYIVLLPEEFTNKGWIPTIGLKVKVDVRDIHSYLVAVIPEE